MPALEVTQLQLDGQKVLVRCDFNVPLDEGRITDPARIDASLDTIRYILDHGGAAVLCSHLGRPKERTPELSLKPVAEYLSGRSGKKVALAPDCIGDVTRGLVAALKPGGALLLENLRFHPEEEANDRDFSHELARGKDVYVNDAFGTAHRAHASTVGVTRFLAERAAGFLMMRELKALSALTHDPARPYIAILGGAKVSDKIGVIRNLMTKVDAILIGGAMAYTFLARAGSPIGRSRVEEDKLELARELMAEAARRGVAFDAAARPRGRGVARRRHAPRRWRRFRADRMGLDIGPRTVERVHREAPGREDRGMERAAGLLRAGGVCARHAQGGRGARQSRGRHQRDRRRRYRGGGRQPAVVVALQPHLDRRRRDAGVPRGHRVAGRQGAREPGLAEAAARAAKSELEKSSN